MLDLNADSVAGCMSARCHRDRHLSTSSQWLRMALATCMTQQARCSMATKARVSSSLALKPNEMWIRQL